ncbi:MAG: hypothetical protein GXY32_04630 [Ruminococcaceae bacterium]|nr:hypothetical protein [Oscillospiraceae bacterium]
MAKEKTTIPFEDFIAVVDPATVPFVMTLDSLMRSAGCTVGIEPAKNGYVVSYKHTGSGRVLANFVFRKKGLVIRLYADNILKYMERLESLPAAMKSKVAKAPLCRRLVNPELCNPHCPKGYEFILDGENHQKCRYNCFMFFLDDASNPAIRQLLEAELSFRGAQAGG